MRITLIAVLSALAIMIGGTAEAQIEDLAEQPTEKAAMEKEKEKDVSFAIHGYAQANIAVARNDIGVKGNKWINSRYEVHRAGGTLQLELEGHATDVAHFFSAVQIEYNATGEKTNFPSIYWPNVILPGLQYTYFKKNADFKRDELSKYPFINIRETYVDLHGNHVTFRAGQQIISWGEIEGIETPSDVIIPWDYTTTSNYFEYARLGVVAANLSFHFANQHLQFLWIPLFQPNKLPLESVYARGVTSIKRPTFEARNFEYATRLSGSITNNLRYGLGFLYGFDDMPDTKIRLIMTDNPMSLVGQFTDLYYNRVLVPTADLNIAVRDVLAWKLSANATFTHDFWNRKKRDSLAVLPAGGATNLIQYNSNVIKKSTVTYLTGPESTNLFAKIYAGIYVGQQWVLRYAKQDSLSLAKPVLEGYGQKNQFKWMLSANIQRYFLENDTLDAQIRFAFYTDPKGKKWEHVIYPYLLYKFSNGVSTALGFVFAKRQGDDRNMVISETRYSF